jgi:hypothetical protein
MRKLSGVTAAARISYFSLRSEAWAAEAKARAASRPTAIVGFGKHFTRDLLVQTANKKPRPEGRTGLIISRYSLNACKSM